MSLRIQLGPRSYDILIEDGLIDRAGEAFRKCLPAKKILVISDTHTGELYESRVAASLAQAGYEVHCLMLPFGEQTKSLPVLEKVYQALTGAGIGRGDAICALGGGVIGDLAGFAAATYMRGIAFVQIPTTLLSQVDSSVGGKVAINLPEGKNLVGSFHQPRLVLIDPMVLRTLPDRYWNDGMGEVIKYGCIRDEKLFGLLASHPGREEIMKHIREILTTCLAIKGDIVALDEHDEGERMLLNFGHTLGHAIEAAQHFEGYNHGEAVAAGMHLICRISESKGLTAPGTADRLKSCLLSHHLPVSAPGEDPKVLLSALCRDKKNFNSGLTVVLLHKIGESYLYPTTPAFFEEVGAWLA